ncbi:MAG: histidine triad nucleotide-binding protein [Clostridia bacterium]|nr:histidine triad nucleotide-binding protein [Clostridia bacterium]
MDNCIFCKIIKGEIPSTKVYEDEYCVAFRDIAPQMPVHIIVTSKKHVPSVLGFTENEKDILGGIQLAIAKIAVREGLVEKGFRVINNCGADAHQSVPHIHYHILAGGDMGERIV